MKRTALIITTALLAAPAFANEDLCSINLQKLDDALATSTTLGEPLRQQVQDLRMKAEQAQQQGDTEACINNTNMALQRLQQPGGEGSGTGGASS